MWKLARARRPGGLNMNLDRQAGPMTDSHLPGTPGATVTQKMNGQQASDMPDLENVWILDLTLGFYGAYRKPSVRPRKPSVSQLLPKRQRQIDVSTATAKMASNTSERPRTPGTQPRQSLSYTALGSAGITLLRVPAGKRLTDSFFSCNYLSLRTLRLRSRRFLVRFVSRRVDRWPVSPPQRIAPRRLPRSRPTRSELRRSRPCAVRSISSIRISSACSTAGPRSPLRSDRSSIIRDWKSGPRPARTR